MRHHRLVVSEKKIKMLKLVLPPHRIQYYRWCHNIFCKQPTYITNIREQQGLTIFNSVGVMLRTDDAGRWTLDAGPQTPYYKLTGELKRNCISIKSLELKNYLTLTIK